MIANLLFVAYAILITVSCSIIALIVVRDLLSGRYKRFKKLQDEFDDFEREVKERRNDILRNKK